MDDENVAAAALDDQSAVGRKTDPESVRTVGEMVRQAAAERITHGQVVTASLPVGVRTRTQAAGKSHLRTLLVAAAGGDHRNAAAIDRGMSYATAEQIALGLKHGRPPYRMRRDKAEDLLAGRLPHPEAILRQLTGRMPISEMSEAPDEEMLQTGHRTPTARKSGSDMQFRPTEARGSGDLAKVIAAFPGIVIRDFRIRDHGVTADPVTVEVEDLELDVTVDEEEPAYVDPDD